MRLLPKEVHSLHFAPGKTYTLEWGVAVHVKHRITQWLLLACDETQGAQSNSGTVQGHTVFGTAQ